MEPVRNMVELRRWISDRVPGVRTLAELAPARTKPVHSTGLPQLDGPLNGGLPQGAVIEVVCPRPGVGGALTISALLRQACRTGQWAALVDGHDSFDPGSVEAATLERLLWIRCRQAEEAMKAVDLVVRDGNLGLVILDLGLTPAAQLKKISATVWYRLQRIAEQRAITLGVVTPRSMVAAAPLHLTLTNAFRLEDLGQSREELVARLAFQIRQSTIPHETPATERTAGTG